MARWFIGSATVDEDTLSRYEYCTGPHSFRTNPIDPVAIGDEPNSPRERNQRGRTMRMSRVAIDRRDLGRRRCRGVGLERLHGSFSAMRIDRAVSPHTTSSSFLFRPRSEPFLSGGRTRFHPSTRPPSSPDVISVGDGSVISAASQHRYRPVVSRTRPRDRRVTLIGTNPASDRFGRGPQAAARVGMAFTNGGALERRRGSNSALEGPWRHGCRIGCSFGPCKFAVANPAK